MSYTFSEEYPDSVAWMPEPNDTVFGRILDLDLFEGEYGVSNVATLITTDDGPTTNEGGEPIEVGTEARVFFFGAYLAGDFKRLKPAEGDVIAIKRFTDGESKKKGHAAPRRFKMKVLSRAAVPEPDFTETPVGQVPAVADARAQVRAKNEAVTVDAEPEF